MAIAAIECIDVDENGVARIAGTRMKVRFLAVESVHLGWMPETIQAQHPDLSLSQIHAALAYYYAHKPEIDAEIEAANRLADEIQANAPSSPVAERLRAMKQSQSP